MSPRKVIKYKIISEHNYRNLVAEANDLLSYESGWEPYGPLNVTSEGSLAIMVYVQAFVRYEDTMLG